MTVKQLKKLLRKFWKRRVVAASAGAKVSFIAIALLLCSILYTTMTLPSIDRAAYQPLLDTIAEGESQGNYNAYFGNPTNNSQKFTSMTVEQVLAWQSDYVAQGSVSSAVGKYQIVRPTLSGLISELNIDTSQRFDAGLQDRLAIALLERRGALDYVDNKLSREQFAANIAKEWAALPKVIGANPNESYYAADGVNVSRVSIAQIYRALDKLNS